MDMSNATAAGPSQGLFDILFGSAPEEAESGDGKEFGSLMDVVKALNKGKEELSKNVVSRTDKGTVTEASQGESLANQASVSDAILADQATRDRELRERMAALYGIGMIPAPMAVTQASPVEAPLAGALPKLDAAAVNRALKEKALPGLTEPEQKLLAAVNEKMAEVNGEAVTSAKLGPAESALVKELDARGINPRDIKGGDAQGVTPEKIVTTESYLKMHEAFGKNSANAVKRGAVAEDASSPVNATPANLARVSGEGESGQGQGANRDNLGDAQRGQLEKLGAGDNLKAKGSSGSFAAELMHSLKAESKAETKDVFLPGVKPEQMRPVLLNEVHHGVNAQALKGGGEMRLVVHPPELGEIQLKVGTKEGKVEVSVTTENKQVAELIRGGSKELENSLQDKNLSLTKFEVSVAEPMTVASTDTKSNLSDQFLSQNQNGFSSAMNRDDSSSARQGSEFGQQPGSGFGSFADESSSHSAGAKHARTRPQPSSSRASAGRLDVVA